MSASRFHGEPMQREGPRLGTVPESHSFHADEGLLHHQQHGIVAAERSQRGPAQHAAPENYSIVASNSSVYRLQTRQDSAAGGVGDIGDSGVGYHGVSNQTGDIPYVIDDGSGAGLHAVSSASTSALSAELVERVSFQILKMPARCPVCIVTVGMVLTIWIVILGLSTLPMSIETNFDSFLKTDVEPSVMKDAFEFARAARESSRRLLEVVIKDGDESDDGATDDEHSYLSRLLDEQERRLEAGLNAAPDNKNKPGSRRLNQTSADVTSSKDVFVAYDLIDPAMHGSQGLFEVDLLIQISTLEKTMRALPMWQSLCGRVQESYRALCSPGISFVSYAMPTADISSGSVVPRGLILDGRGSESVPLQTSLVLAQRHGVTPIVFPTSLSSENINSSSQIRSATKLRSAFRFKLPCCSAMDPPGERKAALSQLKADWESFAADELMPLLRETNSEESLSFRVWYDGTHFHGLEVKEALSSDIALAASASAFVLAYLLFHTRSFLLGFVGLVITVLSVPLAYICSAILLGTTRVSFASFLALFLVVGFGSDVIFVYTDFWRDSRAHHNSMEDRFAWTFGHATRASLATTATTALSFFANLASVIRALRQFGFFMGLCVMLVWLLITFIYAPLCIVDETYFFQWRLRAFWKDKPEGFIEDKANKAPSARVRCLGRWAKHLYRCRYCWCCVPMIAAIVCVLCAILAIEALPGLPSIFPDDHNMNAGQAVMLEFETTDKAFPSSFGAPPEREKVCNEQRFSENDAQTCALYWCESSWDAMSDPDGKSCACFRRAMDESSCPSGRRDDDFQVVQRLVSNSKLSYDRLMTAATSHIISHNAGLYYDDEEDGVRVSELPPMLLQEWETGSVGVGFFAEARSWMKKKQIAGTPSGCGWEDLCFCGELVCTLSPIVWKKQPRLHLRPASRRLNTESTPAATPSGRRRIPAKMRVKLRVSFGLRVERTMPLLGEPSQAGLWSFRNKFSLKDPWAQREMHSFCTDFPKDLMVERTWCWFEDFKTWLHARDERFPTLAQSFESLSLEYIATGSQPTRGTRYIWLYGSEIKGMFYSIDLNLNKNILPAKALEMKAKWDEYVFRWNHDVASASVRGAFHVSDVWVAAEVQSALLLSTMWTLVILIGLAFIGMLIFTRSLSLSLIVVAATIGVVFGLAFFIVVLMGWKVGLIEVIAVIYFVGYAVTYSLHVAHKYAGYGALSLEPAPEDGLAEDKEARHRFQRTSYALKAIGGAALGSAITTAGTSFFLLFCTLTIFTKLGGMCLAVTVMSIFTALGPLPAALMICGPRRPGRCLALKNLWSRRGAICRRILIRLKSAAQAPKDSHEVRE